MLYFVTVLIAIVIIIATWFYFKHLALKNEKLKGEFVTVVTHKFRTPITRIKWIVGMLHDNVTFQQKEGLLKDMELSIEQVTSIIDLLTDFASVAEKPATEYSPVSLRQLVTDSIERHGEQTREKKMAFSLRMGDDVPSLLIDKNKIQFVIDVLIENALKYTGAGGQIVVSLTRQQNQVLLSVADTGIGIAPRDLEAVWSGFWRSDKAKTIDTEGMGMSLHTARAIIENQGGRTWATSPGLDKGATFFVELPIRGFNFKTN